MKCEQLVNALVVLSQGKMVMLTKEFQSTMVFCSRG